MCSRCFHIVSKYPQAIPCLAHNKTLLGKHHTRTDRTNSKDRTDRKDRIRFVQNVNICWQGEHGPLGRLDVSLCPANHSPHCFPGYLINLSLQYTALGLKGYCLCLIWIDRYAKTIMFVFLTVWLFCSLLPLSYC